MPTDIFSGLACTSADTVGLCSVWHSECLIEGMSSLVVTGVDVL